MGFYKQVEKKEYSVPSLSDAPKAKPKFFAKKQSVLKERKESTAELENGFLEDWESLRVRHKGQVEILDAFFEKKKKYIFVRFGRKGAKTATNIDIAWKFAFLNKMSTTYICLPTITQAIEVYWDEKRLQWCDLQDPWMCEKYIDHIDNNKHMITFKNGSTIKLIGTWSESRGRGTQPNLLIVDEIKDCSAEYLDAMEPNLAAKPDSRCVMSGTPPNKKNHFHEWEDRIIANAEGYRLHYSSYINTALPHLQGWLDSKRLELIAAGKEDVWLREYMAEDCFRSDERVLPDIKFIEIDEMNKLLRFTDPASFHPIVAIIVNEDRICFTLSALLYSRYVGTTIFTLESKTISRIWDFGYHALNGLIQSRIDYHSAFFTKPWRKLVFDETETLTHVLPGFFDARKDLKWKNRGIPLLREMILSGAIKFALPACDIGLEAQNLLKEDDIRDFPNVCCMAMLANEYFQPASLSKKEREVWDKYAPLREAGIPAPLPKRKGHQLFSKNWN